MITIVSGLPRSGTSLVMQMLKAGGYPVHWNKLPNADESNPRGYYEWENAKGLLQGGKACDDLFATIDGKMVKIFPQLFPCLSPRFDYQFIYVDRPMGEVIASQRAMQRRLGRPETDIKVDFLLKLRYHAMIYLTYFRHVIIKHESLYEGKGSDGAAHDIFNFISTRHGSPLYASPTDVLTKLKMMHVVDVTMRHHQQERVDCFSSPSA